MQADGMPGHFIFSGGGGAKLSSLTYSMDMPVNFE